MTQRENNPTGPRSTPLGHVQTKMRPLRAESDVELHAAAESKSTENQRPLKNERLSDPDNAVLNVKGVSLLLGISTRSVLRLARQNRLPGKKYTKEWRFSRAAILKDMSEPDHPKTLEAFLKDPRSNVRGVKK